MLLFVLFLAADVAPDFAPPSCGGQTLATCFPSGPGQQVAWERHRAPPGGIFWTSKVGDDLGTCDKRICPNPIEDYRLDGQPIDLVSEADDRTGLQEFGGIGFRVPPTAVVGDLLVLSVVSPAGVVPASENLVAELEVIEDEVQLPSALSVAVNESGVECTSDGCVNPDFSVVSAVSLRVEVEGARVIEANGARLGLLPAGGGDVFVSFESGPTEVGVVLNLLDPDTLELLETRSIDALTPQTTTQPACVGGGCAGASPRGAAVSALCLALLGLSRRVSRTRSLLGR